MVESHCFRNRLEMASAYLFAANAGEMIPSVQCAFGADIDLDIGRASEEERQGMPFSLRLLWISFYGSWLVLL